MSAAPSSGIYVRARPETIHPTLCEGLSGMGFCLLDEPDEPDAPGLTVATITALRCGWSRIEVRGHADAHNPVLAVLNDRSIETFACRWEPARSEYSYVHFRLGSAVESFSGGGSAMGDTKFTSEVRQVHLREVVNPATFVARSLARLGIGGFAEPEPPVRIHFTPPSRRGWFRALLGAAWTGE